MRSRVLAVSLLALVAFAVLVPAALAEKPQTVVFAVDDTGPEAFLTAECGVPVTFHATGRVTVRTFFGSGAAGPVELTTLNVAITVTSGDNSYRFRDVGADHLQLQPDGSLVLSIVGQVPFDFTGVLKLDSETGEAVLEPQHSTADRVDDACAALTA